MMISASLKNKLIYSSKVFENKTKIKISTRSKYDLLTQSRNTSLLQNSVLHMGVRLYKRLLLTIKKLDNFNQFSKEVKSIFLNNLFYTLKEFLQAKLV